MKGHISLSKREKRYDFIYLICIVLFFILILSVIFSYTYGQPFTDKSKVVIQILKQKKRFEKQKEVVAPLIDTIFNNIKNLPLDKENPRLDNQIQYDISFLSNSFEEMKIADTRQEDYKQIADFYEMYFEDKKVLIKKKENIKEFEKQFQNCLIGFKEKKQLLIK